MPIMKVTFIIPDGEPPARADRTLARLLPETPAWRVRAAFDNRDVRCNGRRISPDTLVRAGDMLLAYVDLPRNDDTDRPLEAALRVVFEDADLLVVNKRQGMPTQGTGSVEALASRRTGTPAFACHRLDAQTGGLLLLAKTEAARIRAEEAFRAHQVRKAYRALVRGCPNPPEAALHAYLRKDAENARVRVFDEAVPGALPIETRYRVVEAGMAASRVEVEPITGRTHQIRAQLAHIGHPILGDDKYGDRACNRALRARRQMLWATRLTLWDGRVFTVEEEF